MSKSQRTVVWLSDEMRTGVIDIENLFRNQIKTANLAQGRFDIHGIPYPVQIVTECHRLRGVKIAFYMVGVCRDSRLIENAQMRMDFDRDRSE